MESAADVIYIDSDEGVRKAADAVRGADRVALDTEADSLHHYFEKVCLVQFSIPGKDFILDPLAGMDVKPLLDALAPAELVIQGADYDLRMMRRDYGFSATRIFDTMSAAQLLGYEKFSYAALVERHLGIVLSKHGQKADWSERPLSDKLLTYAAADTHYLLEVAVRLEEELRAAGRLEWHREVCERLLEYVSEGMRPADPERQWRIKGWHTLRHPRGWAYLRELWQWRDAEARRADLPPYKVLRNETLVELAAWAHAGADPNRMPKLPRNIQGRRRRLLDQAVDLAAALRQEQWPKPLTVPRRSTPPPDETLIASLKAARDARAAELKLEPGVLLPSAAITAIAVARPSTPEELKDAGELYNWQVEVLGTQLLSAITDTPCQSRSTAKSALDSSSRSSAGKQSANDAEPGEQGQTS